MLTCEIVSRLPWTDRRRGGGAQRRCVAVLRTRAGARDGREEGGAGEGGECTGTTPGPSVRTRQPLRAIHVRCSDPAALELLRGEFASGQVFDELNVKGWGSLDMDETMEDLTAAPTSDPSEIRKLLVEQVRRIAEETVTLGV